MPCVGYWCPAHRCDVPFDHFDMCDAGAEGRGIVSPIIAAYAAKKLAEDVRHSTLDLTATSTMTCPRGLFIERTTPYTINPQRSTASTRGTASHKMIDALPGPEALEQGKVGYITETNDPLRSEVHGTLFGIPVSAKFDIVKVLPTSPKPTITEIIDAKFPKDWSVMYRGKKAGKADDGHAVQLNIIRLLLDQQKWVHEEYNYDPATVKMTIWDHGIGDREGPVPLVVDERRRWSDGDMAGLRIWGSEYTVQQHVDMFRAAREAYLTGTQTPEQRDGIAAQLPLVGRTMFMGKNGSKCDNSCDVRKQCDALVARWGMPTYE